MGYGHQPAEFSVVQRFRHKDVPLAFQCREERFTYRWILIQRDNHGQPRLRIRNPCKGPAYSPHGSALVFPAVGRGQQNRHPRNSHFLQCGVSERRLLPDGGQESVNYRVACHHNVLGGDTLPDQVVPAGSCGSQMQTCDLRGHPAVGLFRKRRKKVPAAESAFQMHHRYAAVEGSNCSCGGGGGVALDNDGIWLVDAEELVQTVDGAGENSA